MTYKIVLFVVLLMSSCTPKFYKSSIYFGLDIPNGEIVSEKDWENFVEKTVTPRFSAGLSIYEVTGKWRDSESGETISEKSKNIVLFYPRKEKKKANRGIEEIRETYKKEFNQQSIMRVDYGKVKVSF